MSKPPKKLSELPEFLTPKQVAVLFQVKERTVTHWLRNGLMRGVQIGHTWRIPKRAIEEYSNPPEQP